MLSPFVVTADGGRWQDIDRAEVDAAIRLLFAPGSYHELRSLPSGRSRLVSADDPGTTLGLLADLASGARGVYFTLNPVSCDLGDRAAKNPDILRRRWLLVDVDPEKPDKDLSSTDTEKNNALHVASAVLDDLLNRGWPEPLVIDSGNGWHLLFRIDLAADEASRKLVSAALKALAKAHDTEFARIDTKVINASRVSKLPGTMARKGPDTSERPHRLCRLVVAPDAVAPVATELLTALAGSSSPVVVRPMTVSPFIVRACDDGRKSAYVRTAVFQETARVAMAPQGDRNNVLNEASFKIGTLLALGEIDRVSAESQLIFAAGRAGLGEDEARKTVRSGLDAGAAQPRELPKNPTPGKPQSNGAAPKPELAPDGLPVDDDVQTTCLDDVKAVPVEWLMPDRIPIGKLTLLAGLAKQGKSFFTMDLAARVSGGELIPCSSGGECFEKASVVILSAEDDLDDTVKPRLLAAGADCKKIHALTTIRLPSGQLGPFTLSDIPHLERAIVRAGDCKLVVIDPVTHYVGGKVDDHKVAQLRSLLGPLKDLASRRRIAILIVTHFKKGAGTNALHQVIGSSAYTAFARANWMIHRDPKDPRRRLLLDAGTNLAEDPDGLAFRIVDGRLEWEETPVRMNADQALQAQEEAKKDERHAGPAKTEHARDWLANLFAAMSEIPSAEVITQGEAKGFSRDALFAAKKDLGISAKKGRGANGGWIWVRVDSFDGSTVSTLPTVPNGAPF